MTARDRIVCPSCERQVVPALAALRSHVTRRHANLGVRPASLFLDELRRLAGWPTHASARRLRRARRLAH
jgi:hypothetical protein